MSASSGAGPNTLRPSCVCRAASCSFVVPYRRSWIARLAATRRVTASGVPGFTATSNSTVCSPEASTSTTTLPVTSVCRRTGAWGSASYSLPAAEKRMKSLTGVICTGTPYTGTPAALVTATPVT